MIEISPQRPDIPYVHSGIFLATINTACIWSKLSAKKNILSIAKVVNFLGDTQVLEYGILKKSSKERTRWMRSKAFPVVVYVVARYSFSIDFCASSSSCYCIIVESSSSIMIICSFASRFFTSFSSSRCSTKASWASLGELICHFSERICCDLIFDRQFRKVFLLVLQQCSKGCVIIGGRS